MMPFTYRKWLTSPSLTIQFVLFSCLTFLFVVTGPFGTFDALTLGDRTGYWTLTMGANWLVCSSAMMLVYRSTRALSRPRKFLVMAATSVVAAVPGTAVVFTAESLFRPDFVNATILPMLYAPVLAVMLAIGFLTIVLIERREATPPRVVEDARPAPEQPDSRPSFHDRLPDGLGRDLVCLKMADHYVEAFTTRGSTLILMRFSDAVRELDTIRGIQVHRSYWVALDHVRGAIRRNGRLVLTLTGGHEVPVSRGYLAAVRAAGIS